MSNAARRWLHDSGKEQAQHECQEHCNYRDIPAPKASFRTGFERNEVPEWRIRIPMFHDVFPFTAEEICGAGRAGNLSESVSGQVFVEATSESGNKDLSICRGKVAIAQPPYMRAERYHGVKGANALSYCETYRIPI